MRAGAFDACLCAFVSCRLDRPLVAVRGVRVDWEWQWILQFRFWWIGDFVVVVVVWLALFSFLISCGGF